MIAWVLFQQILTFFIMGAMGFLAVKTKRMSMEHSRAFSLINMYFVFPLAIFRAYLIDYAPEIARSFYMGVGIALAVHLIGIAAGIVLGRPFHLNPSEKAGFVYTNSGNLIMPIVSAVLGPQMVIYANSYLCVQHALFWTHGEALIKGERGITLKKLATNIYLITIAVGLVFFHTGLRPPAVVNAAINGVAGMMAPLNMFFIGMIVADIDWKNMMSSPRVYRYTLLKMIVVPFVIMLFIKYLVDPLMAQYLIPDVTFVIFLSGVAPIAISVTMMTQLYNQDVKYATAINVASTLSCIVTIPLMAYLYKL